MFIGESLHASSLDSQSPTTYYGAWFDTRGNGAEFVCNVVAHRGLADPDGCKITVQTKNSEDSDDLAVPLVVTTLTLSGTVPPFNVRFSAGAQVGSSSPGFKELARLKYELVAQNSDPAWFHFRMLNTSWLTNEI
jgi:hypothetical protein